MNKPYRYRVYERYAQLVRERGVRWVMLHGAEYYPEQIGRDLDCLCETKTDREKALACFKQAAMEQPDTRWFCFPHPIWGHRGVAISLNYEMAELHILSGLISGPITYSVQYDDVDWSAVFPQEKHAAYLKSVVLPILGNSVKAERAFPLYGEENLPACIKDAFATLKGNGRITLKQRLRIYLKYREGLSSMICGLLHACKNKLWRYAAHTVPVFYLDPNLYSTTDIASVETVMHEMFVKFIDCTHLPLHQIYRLQSQQSFLYTTHLRRGVDIRDMDGRRGNRLYDFVAESFEAYTLPGKS